MSVNYQGQLSFTSISFSCLHIWELSVPELYPQSHNALQRFERQDTENCTFFSAQNLGTRGFPQRYWFPAYIQELISRFLLYYILHFPSLQSWSNLVPKLHSVQKHTIYGNGYALYSERPRILKDSVYIGLGAFQLYGFQLPK